MSQSSKSRRWTEKEAWAWNKRTGWLVGCNFTPSNAINQLEFWQSESFSPEVIERELGWAAELGFNSVRVLLHNLLWEQDSAGFYKRFDRFLTIAAKHGIGAMPVLFDSCWDPNPKLGRQREPKPGVHNSGWVQAPGVEVMKHPETFLSLRGYVEGVIGRFRNDRRVQIWDLWNEPDNINTSSYGSADVDKSAIVVPFLIKTFAWARNARPSQPITGGVWIGDWQSDDLLSPTNWFLLNASDVISFHSYGDAKEVRARIKSLARFDRPKFCTEYLARGFDSTFQAVLPVLKKAGIGAYNWGFVRGKTQTHLPWDSWQKAYSAEPPVWFHEIFREDGMPYDARETKLIRTLTRAR